MPQVTFTAEQILATCGGRIIQGPLREGAGAICGDIAILRTGDWFIALPSTRSDGHDELAEATARGALGCIVVDGRSYSFASNDSVLIGVASTIQAYHLLAAAARNIVNPKVIAITGSSGKSTTRDMCQAIVSKQYRVHTTSQVPVVRGLANILLNMHAETQVLIAELAQKGRGEIGWLSAQLRPDTAVITNIGLAHLETLGSLANIAAAKCELLEGVDKDRGLAVLGDAGQELMERASRVFNGGRCLVFDDRNIEEVAVTPETTVFALNGSDVLFEIRAHGIGYLRDAWCAIVSARSLGMQDSDIAEGLRGYSPPPGRGNRIIGNSGVLIIDESYSATPDSVRAAVSAFLDNRAVPRSRKFLVLGGLQELGEAGDGIHADLGRWLSDKTFDALITVGEEAEAIVRGVRNGSFETYRCSDASEVCAVLTPYLNEHAAVLVDGSDFEQLEKLVDCLKQLAPARLQTA
ncbi:MAG: UDP-N-acetylmuramoyl-tripeptide--D-alanyl-D-alanine ligase [Cyanobacteria bacterium]|nr:UDP-N-acetylmuramoyl-tripeptide--D-alanyl-D-alanine ligase [Cyanobacteriota bacterium]